ncbi:hypothetical protein GGP41_004634 [Bipolaris sorokiniana]|uniref:Uncharacterized protein n=1 Tax=Cochliobolus sativus TaxID=45130 RepID=A0A8H5ZDB3_COCSA|nr:hypothetical protein GGP41_004634 [Bipolaris sorokiniana]
MRREDDWMEKVEREGYTPRLRSPVGGPEEGNNLVCIGAVLCVQILFAVGASGVIKASNTLAITDDVLVVLRTGVAEALEKLPVHFQTMLRCVDDYVVYSDLDEDIAGHRVNNVFEGSVSDRLRTSANAAQGRQVIADGSLSDHRGSRPFGAQENPAWKLDRFKFLPMVNKTFKYRPGAKWFVFIRTWYATIWFHILPHSTPLVHSKLASACSLATCLFAHGGSGFVLSNTAMRRVVQQRDTHLTFYDNYKDAS